VGREFWAADLLEVFETVDTRVFWIPWPVFLSVGEGDKLELVDEFTRVGFWVVGAWHDESVVSSTDGVDLIEKVTGPFLGAVCGPDVDGVEIVWDILDKHEHVAVILGFSGSFENTVARIFDIGTSSEILAD